MQINKVKVILIKFNVPLFPIMIDKYKKIKINSCSIQDNLLMLQMKPLEIYLVLNMRSAI